MCLIHQCSTWLAGVSVETVGGGQHQPISEQHAPQADSEQCCHGNVILYLWAGFYWTTHSDYTRIERRVMKLMIRLNAITKLMPGFHSDLPSPNILSEMNGCDLIWGYWLKAWAVASNWNLWSDYPADYPLHYVFVMFFYSTNQYLFICMTEEINDSRLRLHS